MSLGARGVGGVGRRKQWTSRPAAGDLWTRHSVIALDPFVFERSQRKRGGDGGGGGALPGQKMVYSDSHFPAFSSLATTVRTVCRRWERLGG